MDLCQQTWYNISLSCKEDPADLLVETLQIWKFEDESTVQKTNMTGTWVIYKNNKYFAWKEFQRSFQFLKILLVFKGLKKAIFFQNLKQRIQWLSLWKKIPFCQNQNRNKKQSFWWKWLLRKFNSVVPFFQSYLHGKFLCKLFFLYKKVVGLLWWAI